MRGRLFKAFNNLALVASIVPSIAELKNEKNRVVLQKDNKYVIVVGTEPQKKESVELVKDTIQSVHPDAILVQVDPAKVTDNQKNGLVVIPPLPIKPKDMEMFRKTEDGILHTIQEWFLVTVLFGFEKFTSLTSIPVGEEFLSALEGAKSLNAKVMFGEYTFSKQQMARMMLSIYGTNHYFHSKDRIDDITREERRRVGIKERSYDPEDSTPPVSQGTEQQRQEAYKKRVEAITDQFSEEISEVLERKNEYIADSIQEIMKSDNSMILVGVVSALNVAGIEKILKEKGKYQNIREVTDDVKDSKGSQDSDQQQATSSTTSSSSAWSLWNWGK